MGSYDNPVSVGVVDNGFRLNHEDLSMTAVRMSGVGGRYEPNKNDDHHNHGMHVAGIIGATVNNGKGTSGVSPNGTVVYAYRTDLSTMGSLAGIAWAASKDVKIINISFGNVNKQKTFDNRELSVADSRASFGLFLARLLTKKDVLIVHAAGNDSNGCDEEPKYHACVDKNFPADLEGYAASLKSNWGSTESIEKLKSDFSAVLSTTDLQGIPVLDWVRNHTLVVGSLGIVDKKIAMSSFSNGGSVIDVFAPGTGIYSLSDVSDKDYTSMSGTSQAAPYVAGVAALALKANPKLSAMQLKWLMAWPNGRAPMTHWICDYSTGRPSCDAVKANESDANKVAAGYVAATRPMIHADRTVYDATTWNAVPVAVASGNFSVIAVDTYCSLSHHENGRYEVGDVFVDVHEFENGQRGGRIATDIESTPIFLAADKRYAFVIRQGKEAPLVLDSRSFYVGKNISASYALYLQDPLNGCIGNFTQDGRAYQLWREKGEGQNYEVVPQSAGESSPSIVAAPTAPTVNVEASFSLASTTFDGIKSIVWKFGETVVEMLNNFGNAIKHTFRSVGDVKVSAEIVNTESNTVATVVSMVKVKAIIEIDEDFFNDPALERLYDVQKIGMDTSGGTLRLPLTVGDVDTTFPFIWIANSGEGTISKLDVATGVELGRYRTGPGNGNPSRTTVDQDGNVWVGNRNNNTITKVGLKEFNQCVDRNGNGAIETSTGGKDIKAWTGNFGDGQGIVNASDECVLQHVALKADGVSTPQDIRTIAIDKDNNVFAGGNNVGSIFKVNGTTGKIIKAANTKGSFYGGLIDKDGNLWAASRHFHGGLGRVLKVSHDLSASEVIDVGISVYGIAIDKYGKIWTTEVGTRFSTFEAANPVGTVKVYYQVGNDQAQGIATDDNGDIFIAGSLYRSVVGHYKQVFTDGAFTGIAFVGNYRVGNGPTGVAVDGRGNVWATNYNDSTVSKITLASLPANAKIETFAVGFHPYNYSDMTGRTVRNITNRQGTWEATFDGAIPNFEWRRVVWTLKQSLPEGTAVEAYAKVANSKIELGGAQYVEVQKDQVMAGMTGRFIKVKFRLTSDRPGVTPEITGIDLQ
ncbi:hypothetical protein C7C56_003045 [Massilia glaciei]|uniref:Peptidase S8/S53 domain-containing protein n=2 Tax=Massilia glaciei TaxID=1524097 RepID=A0A2U2I625_9BURK|nr:hypothetical protein C7C56_003045 [Massilia glaciei]